jgi:Zn-dependent peptidase ImmA (M78 family)
LPPAGVSAAQQAQNARRALGLGDADPIRDVLRLIDEHPGAGIPVAVLPLPEGVAGAYGKKRGQGLAFVNSNDWPVRRRFTLAHEYGHHFLGHTTAVDEVSDVYDRPSTQRERDANSFASEFLIPGVGVRAWMDTRGATRPDLEAIVRLADWYGLSAWVALYALARERFIRPAEREALEERLQAREHRALRQELGLEGYGDALSEEQLPRGGRRMPSGLTEMALRAYRFGVMPADRAASYLRTEESELDAELERRGLSLVEDDDREF